MAFPNGVWERGIPYLASRIWHPRISNPAPRISHLHPESRIPDLESRTPPTITIGNDRGLEKIGATMPALKTVVIMPAYNASRTLEQTFREIPRDVVDECIVVDDFSADSTVDVARKLGLRVFLHDENKGYGGNQKTCYVEALKTGAEIIVMLHPDYQYDPKKIPELIRPIEEGRADLVLGSRMAYAVAGGMPPYKRLSNRFLTWCENKVFGLRLSEYHTGFRAFRRSLLETTPFVLNSNDFIFDQEIVAQAVWFGARLEEISVPHRYFPEASTIGFGRSVRYGLGVLVLLARFILNRQGLLKSRMFRPLHHAYTELVVNHTAAEPDQKP
jgi:glycosyltransferase involved in cell wall biosynthesis